MTQQRQSEPPREQPAPREPLLGLSIPQVAGGALAASTAAAIGSQLGTAGTVLGAALVSIICAVGGALYARTLQHTGRRMSGLVRRPAAPTAAAAPRSDTPRSAEVLPAEEIQTPALSTQAPPTQEHPTQTIPTQEQAQATPDGIEDAPAAPRRRLAAWHYIAAGVAIFALAGLAITVFESLTGQALSGGQGTTVSRVVSSGSSGAAPTDDLRSTPTPSAEPSGSGAPGDAEPTARPTPTTGRTGSAGSGGSTGAETPQPTRTAAPGGEAGSRPTRAPSTNSGTGSAPEAGSAPDPSAGGSGAGSDGSPGGARTRSSSAPTSSTGSAGSGEPGPGQ